MQLKRARALVQLEFTSSKKTKQIGGVYSVMEVFRLCKALPESEAATAAAVQSQCAAAATLPLPRGTWVFSHQLIQQLLEATERSQDG